MLCTVQVAACDGAQCMADAGKGPALIGRMDMHVARVSPRTLRALAMLAACCCIAAKLRAFVGMLHGCTELQAFSQAGHGLGSGKSRMADLTAWVARGEARAALHLNAPSR